MGRLDLGILSLRDLQLSRLDVVSLLPYSAAYPAGSNCVALRKRDKHLGVGSLWGAGRANRVNHAHSSRGPAVYDWMGLLPASATGEELAGSLGHCRARPLCHHRPLVGSQLSNIP